MPEFHRDGTVAVDLLVRQDLPHPSQRRADALDRELRALAADGTVDDYRSRTWPKRITVAECSAEVRDAYLSFRRWADRAEVRLRPFFQTRERYCPDAETYTDRIVVPAMTLAVTVDDRLAAVYPHADGDRSVTVEEGLAALRTAEADAPDETVVLAD